MLALDERAEGGAAVGGERVEEGAARAGEAAAGRDVVEDGGGLGEDAAGGELERGRGKVRRGPDLGGVGERGEQGRGRGLFGVGDPGVLEREADVFAAAGDFGPLSRCGGWGKGSVSRIVLDWVRAYADGD